MRRTPAGRKQRSEPDDGQLSYALTSNSSDPPDPLRWLGREESSSTISQPSKGPIREVEHRKVRNQVDRRAETNAQGPLDWAADRKDDYAREQQARYQGHGSASGWSATGHLSPSAREGILADGISFVL
jgi:hypothetical protein